MRAAGRRRTGPPAPPRGRSSSPAARTVKVLPVPGPSLSAVTVPPCISTRPLTSARPMPSPPVARSMLRSTWENMSKMRGSDSAGMPIPSSRTETKTSSARRSAASQMCPPRRVYLALLVSRLPRTCASRVRSASSEHGLARQRDGERVPGGVDERPGCLHGTADHVGQQHPLRRSSILSRLMREISSRSSISRTMCPSCRSIISRAWATARASAAASRITSNPLRSGASGLRSSWASRARNSSLRRSASRIASSARLRSVMSRATFDAPMIRPSPVAHRGDRQRDVEPAAVLGHADGLEVLDPLPGDELRQDLALLVDAAPAG